MRERLLYISACFTVIILISTSSVLALSDAQLQVFESGIHYFNTEFSDCTVDLSVDLSGNSNVQKAFNFFVSQGLTAVQAAGVVGNMMWESGLDPENIQNPGGRSQNPADAGGSGWGIAQWTPGSKAINLAKTASVTTPIYDLATQLEIAWAQLTRLGGLEQQAGNDIKRTTTIQDAVLAFQGNTDPSAGIYAGHYVGFERPKDEGSTVKRRVDLATQIFNDFSGTATATAAGSFDNGCSSVGPGQDTQYIEGFTVYSQFDPSWANKPYGSETIAESGCGPSAMAMAITALTGRQITPDQAAAYADSRNLYVPGSGSSWNIAPTLAAHWDLNAQLIGKDIAKISATLQTGGLVIASGQGPLPFTSGGHYIVIRGVTSDGKWKIGDSGHSDTSTQSWDPQQLMVSMNDGSVYAITK